MSARLRNDRAPVPPGGDDLAIHRMPGHLVRRLQQVAVALFARRVAELTPVQYAALAALGARGPCDQATLAALIGYDRATLGGVITRLEGHGYVRRAAGTLDRRTKRVSLTPAGRSALRRATPLVEAVQQDLLAPLAPPQRRLFAALCTRMIAAHEGAPGATGSGAPMPSRRAQRTEAARRAGRVDALG
jgi:DNA-binding MarR family transcriptional regulator